MHMFMTIVFICLAALLVLSGGAALYMGLFRASGPEKSLGFKAFSGIVSYSLSGILWFFMYSHHYLNW